MADHSTLRHDPSKPASPVNDELCAPSPDVPAQGALPSLGADLVELAAKFSGHTGAGLSLELSAELALEIVLNEIVHQACLATGATGAAIVLKHDGELVCRARCGETAPELGARLDTDSGLSARCIQTGQLQRCDDAEVDPRADVEACWHMGVRAIMALPLLCDGEAIGILELFSPHTSAFSERDELTIGALARRVLENLEQATKSLSLPVEAAPTAHPDLTQTGDDRQTGESFPASDSIELNSESPKWWAEPLSVESASEMEPRHRNDVVVWVLGVAVVACAMLVGLVIGEHFGWQRAATRAHSAKMAPPAAGSSATPTLQPRKSEPSGAPPDAAGKGKVSKTAPSDVPTVLAPEGTLLVYENGKEVFRMPPSSEQVVPNSEPAGVKRASAVEQEGVMRLSSAAAEGSLLHRVEPDYPEGARQQQIQGAVVLDVRIGQDGAVQDVRLVSGNPALSEASLNAVKQWRFKPQLVKGHRVEMETRVTLNFRLPG